MPQSLRSVLAVIAAYLTMVALVMICTLMLVVVMHVQPGHPSNAYLIANILCSAIGALAGGWLVAYLGKSQPMLHGAVLAGLVLLMSVISFARPMPGQTLGYRVLIAVIMPLCVLGGAATEKS